MRPREPALAAHLEISLLPRAALLTFGADGFARPTIATFVAAGWKRGYQFEPARAAAVRVVRV